MTNEDMQKLIDGMREKLGEENTALVSDDLGTILTDNTKMNKDIENRDNKIEKLNKDKENLINTNGNLLQQIQMGTDDTFIFNNKEKEKDPLDDFNFRDAFDEKGHFKK